MSKLGGGNVLVFLPEGPGLAWRRTSSVQEEPKVQLIEWEVKKDSAGLCYFVGSRKDDGWIRISTPTVEFDPERGHGRTQSGRIYQLVGPAGLSSKGQKIWARYKVIAGIAEVQQ
jgi:hypothetical protein